MADSANEWCGIVKRQRDDIAHMAEGHLRSTVYAIAEGLSVNEEGGSSRISRCAVISTGKRMYCSSLCAKAALTIAALRSK